MKTYLCCIYNSTTGHYSAPIPWDTLENAMNTFVSEIQSPNSEMANIKDRLTVFTIGRYEHTTGKISPYLFKKLLIKGTEVTLTQLTSEKIQPLDFNRSITEQIQGE